MNDIQKLALLNRAERARDFRTDDSSQNGTDPSSSSSIDQFDLNSPVNLGYANDIQKNIYPGELNVPENSDNISQIPIGDRTASTKSADIHTSDASTDDVIPQRQVHELPVTVFRKSRLLLPNTERSSQSEQYRHIKRSLILKIRNAESGDRTPSSIMVTSAIPSEGKTFTALNLAVSFSQETEYSVLFIDADVLKFGATRLLGFDKRTVGLTDFLADKVSHPDDITYITQFPNLSLIPAGTRYSNTTELLSTSRMSDLITSFCRDDPERVVILDTPPLLQTTEATVLADHVGQVAFVVSSASTARSNVRSALAKLRKDMPVGIIINKLSHATNDARYNYQYE